ncbi:MAG: hypothetical protein ACR2M4_02685, partial [Actinomycetota bacterium]
RIGLRKPVGERRLECVRRLALEHDEIPPGMEARPEGAYSGPQRTLSDSAEEACRRQRLRSKRSAQRRVHLREP